MLRVAGLDVTIDHAVLVSDLISVDGPEGGRRVSVSWMLRHLCDPKPPLSHDLGHQRYEHPTIACYVA